MNDLTTSSIFENTKPSLPIGSIDENKCDLPNKIKILTENLQLANNEIEDLNTENRRLKTELEICQKIIQMYKNSGYAENPHSINVSTRKRKKPKLNRVLDDTVETSTLKSTPTLPDEQNNVIKETDPKIIPTAHTTSAKNSLTTDPKVIVTYVGQVSDADDSDRDNFSNNINVKQRHKTTQSNYSPKPVYKKKEDKQAMPNITVKRKLCILSNNPHSGSLQTIENTFSDQFQYCRYSYPNAKINQLLCNLSSKISDYTMNDYCVILLGETDLKMNCNLIELINTIRESLVKIKHTNIIICVPTYI